MLRNSFLILSILCVSAMMLATQGAQTQAFPPVTDQMLANPSPDDWLMFSRTYDAQRYSPLKQISKENIGQLKLVFSTEMKTGTQESIPIVYRGVIYAATPGSGVQAIDGTNGKLIWEYKRPTGLTKTKGLAIYQDMIYYTAPEGVARSRSMPAMGRCGGNKRSVKPSIRPGPSWSKAKSSPAGPALEPAKAASFPLMMRRTGEAVWKFQNVPAPGEPGADSWGPGGPGDNMMASTWALMGSFDPVRECCTGASPIRCRTRAWTATTAILPDGEDGSGRSVQQFHCRVWIHLPEN